MTGDEKQAFANEAEQALAHPLVEQCVDELMVNLRCEGDNLVRYGINKVGMYVAAVARAQALGSDPDELRMTDDEAGELRMALLKAATDAGTPVIVVQTRTGGTGRCR